MTNAVTDGRPQGDMIYRIPEDASEKALELLRQKCLGISFLRDETDRRYRRKRFHIMGLKGQVSFPVDESKLPKGYYYVIGGTRTESEKELYSLYADRILTFSVDPLREANIERGGFIPSDMGVLRIGVTLDCDDPPAVLTEMVRRYLDHSGFWEGFDSRFGSPWREYYNYCARTESANSWGIYVYHDLNRFLEDPRLFAKLISGACDEEFPAEKLCYEEAPFCGLFGEYPVCQSALEAVNGHLGEPMALVSAYGQGPELRNRQRTRELQQLARFADFRCFSLFGSYEHAEKDPGIPREAPAAPESEEEQRRQILDEEYSRRLAPVGSRIHGRENIDKEIVTVLCSDPADVETLHNVAIGLAARYGQANVLLVDTQGRAQLYYTRDALDPSGAPAAKGTCQCLGDLRSEPEKALKAFMARPGKRLFRISSDESYGDSAADLCIGRYGLSRYFWMANPGRLESMKGLPREKVIEKVKDLAELYLYHL